VKRQLQTDAQTTEFVQGVLKLQDPEAVAAAARRITDAEILEEVLSRRSTLTSNDFRDYRYAHDQSRRLLREQIREELTRRKRLKKDDDIALGKGGARPRTALQSQSQAFILIGLPASGKSTAASEVADHYGAIVLDSDYAKRKFPEFDRLFGASLVHNESALVVFGNPDYPTEYPVINYCIDRKHNLVIPKIGNNEEAIVPLAETLQSAGYQVHLTLVNLDRLQATQRAYSRFLTSGRYVSLTLIYDVFANEPQLTFQRLKDSQHPAFASYGSISTNVQPNHRFQFISGDAANPASLYQSSAYV
jgi:hypothetical protein